MNSREKYFNTINFDKYSAQWSHGPVVRGCTFSLEEVGVQLYSYPCVATSFFFNGFLLFGFVLFPLRGYFFSFPFIVFLPFGFVLFILTADLVSFARFLRKRISSFRGKLTRCIVRSHM